jgi:hypothetical protein
MKRILLLILMIGMMSGCASVKVASVGQDAEAKSFAVALGKANIYIVRNDNARVKQKMSIEFDGVLVGRTIPKSYLQLQVIPGMHSLSGTGELESKLSLEVRAGENYFVEQEITMVQGKPTTKLSLLGEATGRASVQASKLLVSNYVAPKLAAAGKSEVQITKPASSNSSNKDAPPRNVPVAAVAGSAKPVTPKTNELAVQKSENTNLKIETLQFQPGISTVTVENMAKKVGCQGGVGAGLISEKGPVEIYRMLCDNGTVFKARCELRQCKQM